MKKFILISLLFTLAFTAHAQKVDSICFHLYTDSVKKSTTSYKVYNYINIDGMLSNGRWLPLTAKEIIFSSSAGKFEGNNLILDPGFKGENITIKAVLKTDSGIWKEIVIGIKKGASLEKLKTEEDILNQPTHKQKKNKKASEYTQRS